MKERMKCDVIENRAKMNNLINTYQVGCQETHGNIKGAAGGAVCM